MPTPRRSKSCRFPLVVLHDILKAQRTTLRDPSLKDVTCYSDDLKTGDERKPVVLSIVCVRARDLGGCWSSALGEAGVQAKEPWPSETEIPHPVFCALAGLKKTNLPANCAGKIKHIERLAVVSRH